MGSRCESFSSLCALPSLQVPYRVQKADQAYRPHPSSRNANTNSARANSSRRKSITPRRPRSLRNRKRSESTGRWSMVRVGFRQRRGRSRSRRQLRRANRRRRWRLKWQSRKRRRRRRFPRGETGLCVSVVMLRPISCRAGPVACACAMESVSSLRLRLGSFSPPLLLLPYFCDRALHTPFARKNLPPMLATSAAKLALKRIVDRRVRLRFTSSRRFPLLRRYRDSLLERGVYRDCLDRPRCPTLARVTTRTFRAIRRIPT